MYRLILWTQLSMLGLSLAVSAKPAPVTYDKARLLYKEGMVFRQSGKNDAARQRFIAAIEADNAFTAAYSELSNLYFEQESYASALLYSRKAKQLGAPCMNSLIGQCCYHMGDYENALESLLEARDEEPENKEILYLLAKVHTLLGNYRESIHCYKEDLRMDSTHKNAWYELGVMFFNAQDFSAAVASFEKAAALGRSEDSSFLYNLAHALYSKGSFASAIIQWEKLLYLQPENAFAMFMLGKSYIGAGEEQKGLKLCDKAMALEVNKIISD
ncbi:MAG TPA: tetratricopeptide repeat protein [Chitinophaga sp.]|uniref:tetratricopeptide repeat protein n=1 Tax=Chitinophaga sp. TaxID=1869181 RepID=UPI002BF901DC|nr:tetratricopeptide repeat protein [Chitinophaga sp.]HVI44307.1 tetratricopeptide repeat protein [Chitinophaga sp.]